jgi:hypothetical protein
VLALSPLSVRWEHTEGTQATEIDHARATHGGESPQG